MSDGSARDIQLLSELKLIDALELKFALAPDAQLEKLLAIYLCPLLLKLGSVFPQTTEKVRSILKMIDDRLNGRGLKLPTKALLDQYQNKTLASTIRDVSVLYLDRAMASDSDNGIYLSGLVQNYSLATAAQQTIVFNIVCRILASWQVVDAHKSTIAHIESNDAPSNEGALGNRFIDLMFLNLAYFRLVEGSRNITPLEVPRPVNSDSPNSLQAASSGLKVPQIEFLTPRGAKTFTVGSLNQVKRGLLRFASHATSVVLFDNSTRFIISLIGSFDLDNDIQLLAGKLQRQYPASDDAPTATRLYSLVLDREYLQLPLRVRAYQSLTGNSVAVSMSNAAHQAIKLGIECSYTQVRYAALGLLRAVAQRPVPAGVQVNTAELVEYLTELLAAESTTAEARDSAYTAMGLLCLKDPGFTQENVKVVDTLFNALCKEKNGHSTIHTALLSLVPVYRNSSDGFLSSLAEILVKVLLTGPTHAHRTVLGCVLSSFKFTNVAARWICLLTIQVSSASEILHEAKLGLDPYQLRLVSPQNCKLDLYPESAALISWPDKHVFTKTYSPISGFRELQPQVVEAFVMLARTALYTEVLPSVVDLSREHHQDIMNEVIKYDLNMRRLLRGHLTTKFASERSQTSATGLTGFVQLLTNSFFEQQSELAARMLIELLALDPESFRSLLLPRLPSVRDLALSARSQPFRRLAGKIFAITGTHPSCSMKAIEDQIEYLRSYTEKEKEPDPTILVMMLLRMAIRGRNLFVDLRSWEQAFLDGAKMWEGSNKIPILDTLSDLAMTTNIHFRSEHILVLVRFWNKHKTKPQTEILSQIASTLAALSTSLESESEQMTQILALFLSCSYQNVELSLSIGEALAYILGRWQSRSFLVALDVPSSADNLSQGPGIRYSLLTSCIERLIQQLISSSLPERRGAYFKLLAILQLLDCPEIQSTLATVHSSFLKLLSEKDDLLAEATIKGLQAVYHRGDPAQQDEMIVQVFRTFKPKTASKRIDPQQEHVGDSAVPLSETNLLTSSVDMESSSARIYRDIYNLCIEIGHKSFMYPLLNMVSIDPIFSSHWEATLGFRSFSIDRHIEKTMRQSPDVLRRLLSKLYRYKHDPSARTASRFNTILMRLFPEEKEVVDREFNFILDNMLNDMTDSLWRTRESAVKALTSLVIGRSISQIRPHLESLWNAGFRALDDVKESVRDASLSFCKALSVIVLKSSESVEDSRGSVFELAVPLLLKEIHAPSKDVSSFSLGVLFKITKGANSSSIRPYLPALIEEYLLLTSNMEPETLNYLSFHVSKYDLSQGDLDQHRLSAIRNSPVLDALEQCIDHLDHHSATLTMPRIFQVIGQTHGLPTRAATSRFLISLTSRNPELMRSFADATIRALSKSLNDRSETVISLSASAIGYLSRVASNERIVTLVTQLSKKLGEDDHSIAPGLVVRAISQNANDRFHDLGNIFLPLCFLAMHDPEEGNRTHFKAVWDNNTGSTGAVKLYQKEIISLAEQYLSSPVWRMRQIAANSLAQLATSVALKADTQQDLFRLLSDGLSGRVWQGKESVLSAFVSLMKNPSSSFTETQWAKARDILAREASRTSADYRSKALTHYATFLETDESHSSFQAVYDAINKAEDSDEADDEQDTSVLQEVYLRCLVQALRPAIDHDRVDHYQHLLSYSSMTSEKSKSLKLSVCKSLGITFKRIAASPLFWTDDEIHQTWILLKSCLTERAHRNIREEAVATCRLFHTACVAQGMSTARMSDLKEEFGDLSVTEADPVMQTYLQELSVLFEHRD